MFGLHGADEIVTARGRQGKVFSELNKAKVWRKFSGVKKTKNFLRAIYQY
jgi:hypothetical protein